METKITLYEIDSTYNALLNECRESAEQNSGEIDPALAWRLEAIEMTRDIKIEHTLRYQKNENAVALMLMTEIESINKRLKVHENNALWAKNYLAAIVRPGEKLEYGCGRISWRKNPPSVEVVDFQALPDEYKRVIPERKEPDKIAIGTALKSGKEVAGAKLVEKELSITIK